MKSLQFHNIFHKVTFEGMRKNRTRTLVTILGILLSTALITAITTFISSLNYSMIEYKITETGNWHGAVLDVEESQKAQIAKTEGVSTTFYLYDRGYAEIENANDQYAQYLHVQAADATYLDQMSVEVLNGRMPENSSEILLPDTLISQYTDRYQIGQELELSLGSLSGKSTVTDKNTEMSLTQEQSHVYTVVGSYHAVYGNYDSRFYSLLTVYDQTQNDKDCDVYYRVKNTNQAAEISKQFAVKYQVLTNDKLLQLMGSSKYTSYVSLIYGLAVIVIVLVMSGSILLIYNSFAISVSERTRQYGLLSSIGATRAQLRQCVLFESLFVSLIGIPLGIMAGIAGIGITLACIRSSVEQMAINIVSIGKLNLHISWMAILIAALVALFTVLISAFIPMIRVSRITAMDAIRQTKEIKFGKRAVRTSKLFYHIFGFEGMLAKKYYKRSKKKYRTTVFSLVISIVLFIAATSLSRYMIQTIENVYQLDAYQISFSGKYDFDDAIIHEMCSVEGILKTGMSKSINATLEIAEDALSEDYKSNLSNCESTDGVTVYSLDELNENSNTMIYILDDDTFAEYLKENNLSAEIYNNPEQPVFIASAVRRYRNKETGKITDISMLKDQRITTTISVLDSERYYEMADAFEEAYDSVDSESTETDTTQSVDNDTDSEQRTNAYDQMREQCTVTFPVTIGCVLDDLPFAVEKSGRYQSVYLFCTESVFLAMQENSQIIGQYVQIYLDTEDHNKVAEELRSVAKNHNIAESRILDNASEYESQRSLVFIIRIFANGFIILMSLIAMVNVFNTVSTNLILRRREFAMLRSVGLTKKGFNRMMYFECLLYGSRSLMIGVPISLAFTYWIYRVINRVYVIDYQLPYGSILIACISVFLVVFITMWYSRHKINQINMIESIKNENV